MAVHHGRSRTRAVNQFSCPKKHQAVIYNSTLKSTAVHLSTMESVTKAHHLAPTGFAPAFFMRTLYNEVFAVMNSVL